MIAFKQMRSVDEFSDAHTMLREILYDLARVWPDAYMEITRIYNPPVEGESGVHRTIPHRAADVRTNDLPIGTGIGLVEYVNSEYDYGHAPYKVAMQHGEGPARHLHLQVQDETHARPRSA